jgi:hypothetical protein
MKTYKIYLTIALLTNTIYYSAAQETFIAKPAATDISKALEQVHIVHSLNMWPVKQIDTDNNFKIVMEAIEYKAMNQTQVLKGLRVILTNKQNGEADFLDKALTQVTTYIEDNEYAEVLVALDNIIKDLQLKQSKKVFGEMNYLTKGGVRIGYNLNPNKPLAYVAIKVGDIEISAESTSPDEFLQNIKDQFDIVNKELYLPENAEKLKKAKKSGTKDTKDVNIEDL